MSVGVQTSGTTKKLPKTSYRPLAWQVQPLMDKSPVMLLTGSAGGGKSRCAAEKIHAFCKKYPGSMALMLRKARQSMTNSTVLFFEKTIIGEDRSVRHLPSKLRFEYNNGSILAYGGMNDESQKEQIRSIGQGGGLDIAWMEEANRFTESDYDELLGRMRGVAAPWSQIILTTNPDGPSHWIRRRLILNGEARTFFSKEEDNPYNPDNYKRNLAMMTGVTGARLRDGQWVRAEGIVYDNYSDLVHLIDPFEIPEEGRRIISIDFGFNNPMCVQWWYIDGDERMFLYRELYMTRRTVRQHAEMIAPYLNEEPIEAIIADHDAEDRATLEESGIYSIPAIKDVKRGLEAVRTRLDPDRDTGKPSLFIFKGCLLEQDDALVEANKPTCTAEEFPMYVWPKLFNQEKLGENPLKANDHGMDPMRYAVMYVDSGEYGMESG